MQPADAARTCALNVPSGRLRPSLASRPGEIARQATGAAPLDRPLTVRPAKVVGARQPEQGQSVFALSVFHSPTDAP